MNRARTFTWIGVPALAAFWLVPSCQVPSGIAGSEPVASELTLVPAQKNHLAEVMTSAFCAKCHPAMYAEHNQNTHGRAFTDAEPRLATNRFTASDCINCHTPRPIFETGIGMNPLRRYHNLEEGNTCMTCHWRPDFDYSSFEGGAKCKTAFHPDVGKVDACATCHRNHGTPYQWEKAPLGNGRGQVCMKCHMKKVLRPVAIGEKPRLVRSHVFPGSRSESQLRKAYKYETRIEGNEIVVRITNHGTGHNFPTELKQRSLESLIIVKDAAGKEKDRSRMVFRDPYKRPYGLRLPVNTQIPSGEFREHRVPLRIADGTVQTELHFKLYFPIEDNHPELARQLELRQILFTGITPSTEEVISAPEVRVVKPEGTSLKESSPAQWVDFARPQIGTTVVPIPPGTGPEDIEKLIDLFMFPVPQAQDDARRILISIGKPAVPRLIEAMGSWDNKTWKNAMKVLFAMGEKVRADLLAATNHDQLYVRIHARSLLADLGRPLDDGGLSAALIADLSMPAVLDKTSAADALGRLQIKTAAKALRPLLGLKFPDVVRSAALALARIDDEESVPAIRRALAAAPFVETRGDLAKALAMLGNADGIPLLIAGLDHRDDLIREHFFERLFDVTGLHLGFDPLAPRPERLEAISRLNAWWAAQGGPDKLHRPWPPSMKAHRHAWKQVDNLAKLENDPNDPKRVHELITMGDDAVPALILGLKFPVGFAKKRYLILDCLGAIGSKRAAPFVASALRDPVVLVADRAAVALARIKDSATLPALRYYHDALLSKIAAGTLPQNAPDEDILIANSAATRLLLGDRSARSELVSILLSPDETARVTAHRTLTTVYDERHGYDPLADATARRHAGRKWQGN